MKKAKEVIMVLNPFKTMCYKGCSLWGIGQQGLLPPQISLLASLITTSFLNQGLGEGETTDFTSSILWICPPPILAQNRYGFTHRLRDGKNHIYFRPYFSLDLDLQNYDRLDVMRKVWVYKRKNTKGWYVGWYESGKRKAKALPTKALAEHYRKIKYAQLNSDVFTGIIAVDWFQMREEYSHYKRVKGDVQATLYETALTLSHFERLIGKLNSRQITQNTIDKFILDRGREVKRSTLNKDIRNLKAFVNWCRENRYLNGDIKLKTLKEDERPVKSLTGTQIQALLSASLPYPTLRMRVLLALGTGLRRGDIESWRVSDIDFENSTVTTRSIKTRKSMGSRPVPVPIMVELKKYVLGLPPEQDKIFKRCFNKSRWDKVRRKVGLIDFKFHDLRKTFGSVLAQNGVSTVVIQKLLEHSSPDLTNKVYTNVDPVLRQAIDTMPASDWLRVCIISKQKKAHNEST